MTRAVVEYVFERAQSFHRRGLDKEVLTVGNHADSALLWMRICRQQPKKADEIWQMLAWNGGNQSGVAVASVDPAGAVHADQFSWGHSLGNVRERPFSAIWADLSEPRLAALRESPRPVGGRCASCRFMPICNGNLRARAESYFGDFLAPDPSCYLTDAEIGFDAGSTSADQWAVPVQEAVT